MALGRDEILASFHQALGRFVHAIARLDFDVGMLLIALEEKIGADNSVYLKPNKSLNDRLLVLKKQIKEAAAGQPSENETKTAAWFVKAGQLRGLRNDYVHARWGIPGTSETIDPIVKYVPMHWNWDSVEENIEIQIPVSALLAQAIEVENLADEFYELAKGWPKLTKAT